MAEDDTTSRKRDWAFDQTIPRQPAREGLGISLDDLWRWFESFGRRAE